MWDCTPSSKSSIKLCHYSKFKTTVYMLTLLGIKANTMYKEKKKLLANISKRIQEFFALLISFWSEKLLIPFNVTSAALPCAYLIIIIQFMILLIQIFFPKSFSLLERNLLCFWCCPTNCWSASHSSRQQGVSCMLRFVSNCSEGMFTVISISDAYCAEHTFFKAWWSYKIIGIH